MPVVGRDLAPDDCHRIGAQLGVERFHQAERRDLARDIYVRAHP